MDCEDATFATVCSPIHTRKSEIRRAIQMDKYINGGETGF